MIGRTISHYKIVDKIGEGGMGAVWRAASGIELAALPVVIIF